MSTRTEEGPRGELAAMQAIVDAVEPLDHEGCGRVLRWACDRYGAFTDFAEVEPDGEGDG